jgi:hypothetical protein
LHIHQHSQLNVVLSPLQSRSSLELIFVDFRDGSATFRVKFISLPSTCALSSDQQTFQHNAFSQRDFFKQTLRDTETPNEIFFEPTHRYGFFSSFSFFLVFAQLSRGYFHAASFFRERILSQKRFTMSHGLCCAFLAGALRVLELNFQRKLLTDSVTKLLPVECDQDGFDSRACTGSQKRPEWISFSKCGFLVRPAIKNKSIHNDLGCKSC